MKNIKDLRESLLNNYQKMTREEMPLATGKELANTAGKIINSCKVELVYNQFMGIKKKIEFLES